LCVLLRNHLREQQLSQDKSMRLPLEATRSLQLDIDARESEEKALKRTWKMPQRREDDAVDVLGEQSSAELIVLESWQMVNLSQVIACVTSRAWFLVCTKTDGNRT
jgi:hypothetical protein